MPSSRPAWTRWKLDAEQLRILDAQFQLNPLPSLQVRKALAAQFGVSPRKVQVWFQNRRQRLKSTFHEDILRESMIGFRMTPTEARRSAQYLVKTLSIRDLIYVTEVALATMASEIAVQFMSTHMTYDETYAAAVSYLTDRFSPVHPDTVNAAIPSPVP